MASVHQPERLHTQSADKFYVQATHLNVAPTPAWSFNPGDRQRADDWRDTMQKLGFSVCDLAGPACRGASAVSLTSPLGVEFVVIEAANQLISAGRLAEPRTTWMAILLTGRASLVIGQRVEALSLGDIAHGPGGQMAAVGLEVGCRVMFVRAPQIVTDLQADPIHGARISRLAMATSGVRILSGLLRATAHVLEGLTASQLRPVELALVEFFKLWAVEHQGDEREDRAHLRRLRQTIETLMPDPALSLRRLADSEGVTPRYVQKLFGTEGETFGGYLRARRLERCRLDMKSPQHAARSTLEISSRWGFTSAVQFSRAFRKRFGVSPRQDRRDALMGG